MEQAVYRQILQTVPYGCAYHQIITDAAGQRAKAGDLPGREEAAVAKAFAGLGED